MHHLTGHAALAFGDVQKAPRRNAPGASRARGTRSRVKTRGDLWTRHRDLLDDDAPGSPSYHRLRRRAARALSAEASPEASGSVPGSVPRAPGRPISAPLGFPPRFSSRLRRFRPARDPPGRAPHEVHQYPVHGLEVRRLLPLRFPRVQPVLEEVLVVRVPPRAERERGGAVERRVLHLHRGGHEAVVARVPHRVRDRGERAPRAVRDAARTPTLQRRERRARRRGSLRAAAAVASTAPGPRRTPSAAASGQNPYSISTTGPRPSFFLGIVLQIVRA